MNIQTRLTPPNILNYNDIHSILWCFKKGKFMYLLLLVTMMDSNDEVVEDSDDLTQDGDVMTIITSKHIQTRSA